MESQKLPSKRYKRVKRVEKVANPLFEKWLTDWRDEASAKGWKTQHSYQKALASLKRYPLTLKSGREAKILEFFGDKLCQKLDEKLEEYAAEHPEENLIRNETNEDSDDCVLSHPSIPKSTSDSSPTKQKPTRTKTTRMYVPLIGSGAHAILIALYKHELENGSRSFMKKYDLMDAAQPYCDTSFRISEAGKFHTAWSSMGNLVRKGLVIKESTPAKYYLTEKGIELGQKILESFNKISSAATGSQGHSSGSDIVPSSSSENNSLPSSQTKRLPNLNDASLKVSPNQNLEYCYIDDAGKEVGKKDMAVVNIDGKSVSFLIKCKRDQLFVSGKFFKVDQSRSADSGFIYAFLHNDHADEYSPKSNLTGSSNLAYSSNLPLHAIRNESEFYSCSQEVNGFTLQPGSFEIVLCVDICETVAGARNERKLAIQSDLRKNGVLFDVRKLNVGDFVWIAREKVKHVPGQLSLPKSRELVLDFIIERKRMDDLANSIKDGRFHEQKYRLKHCGLRKPIYLIEEMGAGAHYSLPESSLLQAITNTQVIDGFTIKRTANQAGTIMYLTLMTRYLQSSYSIKTLISCKHDVLPSQLCPSDDVCLLMNFEEFNSVSTKNKEQTILDLFVRHLIQIRGLSVDKAVAITKQYSTPTSLLAAYKKCATDKEKENLLSNIKFGTGQRNLGPKLSKILHKLYSSENLT